MSGNSPVVNYYQHLSSFPGGYLLWQKPHHTSLSMYKLSVIIGIRKKNLP
jgi:hypothetical protein